MTDVLETWAKIKKVSWLAPKTVSVELFEPQLAKKVQPGQFFGVKIPNSGELLLRRPISVADVKKHLFRLIFKVVGKGTTILSKAKSNDEWSLLGPLGKPAFLPDNREVFLVGGGVGAAPLLFLCRRLVQRNRVKVVLGARTKRGLILKEEFEELGVKVHVTTEDGSIGERGVVTTLTERLVRTAGGSEAGGRGPVVFACGPKEMLKDLNCRLKKVEVWGFFEERLGCGLGICYGCALPKKNGGYIRLCREGPVLPLREVLL